MPDFIPDLPIKRIDIHKQYGGSSQHGISASAKSPYIFIFTGTSGEKYGYKDNWDNNNVFAYTGEGQVGDMVFTKGNGNTALRDHLINKKRVFLFLSGTKKDSRVRFVSELEILDYATISILDRNKKLRDGIRFFFKRKGTEVKYDLKELNSKAEDPAAEYKTPGSTERQSFVTSRVGQGAYRKSIVNRWEGQCAVTGFNDLKILVASHIHPWSKSNDSERLDLHNGILLSPTYDALFDRNLISFEDDGKIILSDSIEPSAYEKLGVTGKEKIIRTLTKENHIYLEKHRARLIKKS